MSLKITVVQLYYSNATAVNVSISNSGKAVVNECSDGTITNKVEKIIYFGKFSYTDSYITL